MTKIPLGLLSIGVRISCFIKVLNEVIGLFISRLPFRSKLFYQDMHDQQS